MQKVIDFLGQVKDIFHQITWPDKNTLFQLTIVVISISIITSLILGGFDYLFTQSFSLLGQIQNPLQPAPVLEQPIPESTESGQASDSGQFDLEKINLN